LGLDPPPSYLLAEQEINMNKFFSRFVKDESGATAIEYGLIAALIAVVIISGATALGTALNSKLQTISNSVTSAGS
jgi:pilus assembly protein Flp/PilA